MTVRSGWRRSSSLLLLRSRKGLSSLSELNVFSASASSSAAPKSTTFIGDSPKRYLRTCYSDFVRQYTSALSSCSRGKGMLEANGKMVLGAQHIHKHAARTMLSFQPVTVQGACATNQCFVRSFASKASKKETKNEGQTRKEVSTIEDPFDAPTYNIPEKPVTFTEGARAAVANPCHVVRVPTEITRLQPANPNKKINNLELDFLKINIYIYIKQNNTHLAMKLQ